MSIGAQLEGSSLEWLQQLDVLENNGVNRTNRVLNVGAQNVLNQLNGAYKKLQDSKGTNNRYVAQQAEARLANISDLLPPKQKRALVEAQKAELTKAQQMGGKSGVDLARIAKEGSLTLKENAKPNLNAIDNAGKRLNDFWSKENQSFRDRVTALTQVNLAEGKSYRNLAGQVRSLLLLEQQQGTESARSTRVNQKMGISQRAEVIARTEMQTAFVQGQINNYRGLGYEWARWSAAAERTCGYCMSRDGLVFVMEEVEGSIPAHPRCRCTLIPVEKPAGIGDKKPSQLQADEFLDDQYWQKSRKDKLDQWKDDQNKTKSGQPKAKELLKSNSDLDQALRRYERTPTNQQEYLRPGSDAPQPKWKPSGDTIPDLVKAQKAALAEQQGLVNQMKRAQNQDTKGVVKKRPGETETFKKHSNATGGEPGPDTVWTPERQKLHAEILDHFLKNGVVSDNPTFTMSGGGPASGKGFMLKKTGLEKPGRVILDADEIKKLIPEYADAQKKGGKAQQKAASQVHEESSYLAKKLMAEAANRGFDVVLDGTGDNGLKSLKKKVDNMRAKGYRVEAKYVSADTDVAAQRNWDRFLKTGRLPPEHMLRNVHRDVSKTLPEAMDAGIFDAVELYDTNKSGELRLVASQKNGGKQTIHDKKLWDDFKRKGEAETWTSEQGERAITQRKLKENPKATDTAQRHSSARGKGVEPDPTTVWTAERQKLHDDIVKHFLKDGKISKNPTFTMSGGGPASGKGFMLKKTGLDQPGKVVIDADEIKKLIPEYAEMQKAGGKKGLKAAAYVHEESSYLAKRIMGEAADAGFDVVLDGTGDNGVKSLGKKVKKMKEKGYRVEAKYVSADTEVAVQRNWDRFLKTGRLPPEHMLRNVHRDVSRTVPKALADDLFDSFELFDTNQSGELRRILHKEKGSKTVVDDAKLLHRFLDKGKAQQVTEADVIRMQEARQLKELPTASDSAGRHSNARGKGAEPGPDTIWTHDRKKLHDDIVNQFLKDGVVSSDPTFTMSGGGPASGKGFMLKKTGLDKPGKVVVDSDEIKKLIPEYAEMQKAGGAQAKKAAGYVHEESSYLAKRVMDEASSRGFDVILDGTGDNGLASLKKKVDKMRAKGYKVEAKYVSADTEVAAERNWERFLKTGRLPPESMLRNVHRDVSRTLPEAIDADLFDKVELYDTNKTGELRKVIGKEKGKKATIDDDALWQRFLKKADAETFTATDDARLMKAQEKRMPKLPDAPPAKPKAEPKAAAKPKAQPDAEITGPKTKDVDFKYDDHTALGYGSKADLTKAKKAIDGYVKDHYDPIRMAQAARAVKAGKDVDAYSKRAAKELIYEEGNAGVKKWGQRADTIEDFIRRAPKYDGEVHRGMNFSTKEMADQFLTRIGSGAEELTINSWSTNKGHSSKFAGGQTNPNAGDAGLLLTVKNKNGAPVSSLNPSGEGEVLMPSGVRYRVVEVKPPVKRGKVEVREVVLEQLPDGFDVAPVSRPPAAAKPPKAPKPPATRELREMLGRSGRVDTDLVKADPDRFQYKQNANKTTGEVGSLKGANKWNEELAGVMSVWRDPASDQLFVINGHNRLALAKRMGVKDIPVLQIKAKTAQEARMIGAKQNIASGDGTAIDAAKFMRDSKLKAADLQRVGMNLKAKVARDGAALANLPDHVFTAAVEGRLPLDKAVALGRSGLEPAQMADAYKVLKDRPNMQAQQVDALMAAARASQTRTKREKTLFGETAEQVTTMVEQAKVAANVKADLKKQISVLEKAAKNADALKAKGNRIDVNKAELKAANARAQLDVFDAQVFRPGSKVNQALTKGAAAVQDATGRGGVAKASKAAKDSVLDALDADVKTMQRQPGGVLRGVADLNAAEAGRRAKPPELEFAGRPDITAADIPAKFIDPAKAKPGTMGGLRPDQIAVDADRFQYKATSEKSGEVGSLDGVSKFDRNLAGVISVWKDPANGQTYVINGHNRLAAAKRLGADAVEVRYIKAKDASEARSVGAMANIAEGHGTAIDAAKWMRETGLGGDGLRGLGMAMKKDVAVQGAALSNLPDDLWQQVVNETISPEKAAAIGGGGLDGQGMANVAKVLKHRPNASVETVRELVAAEKASMEMGSTGSLFGEDSAAYQMERAQLTRDMRRDILGDKQLFNTLASNRAKAELESAGSTLDMEANARAAAEQDAVLSVYDQLKNSSGPVADALSRGARAMEGATSAADKLRIRKRVRDDIGDAVREELGSLVPGQTELPPEAPGQESLF